MKVFIEGQCIFVNGMMSEIPEITSRQQKTLMTEYLIE